MSRSIASIFLLRRPGMFEAVDVFGVERNGSPTDQMLVLEGFAACIGLIQTSDHDRVDAGRPVHAEQTCVRTSVAHPPHVRTSRDPPARSQAPSCTVVPGPVHRSRGGTVTC